MCIATPVLHDYHNNDNIARPLYLHMQFKSSQFVPRTPETYDYHCSLLCGAFAKENSTTYGVNYVSPLNKICNFHVVRQYGV